MHSEGCTCSLYTLHAELIQVPHFRDTVQAPHFCDTVQFRHQKIRTGVVLLNLVKIQMPVEPTFSYLYLSYTITTGQQVLQRTAVAARLISFAVQASVDTWTTQRRSNPLTAETLDYECQRFLICVHNKISTASAPTQPHSDELNFKTRFQA